MSTELEAKRLEYKKLRATLSSKHREEWRQQEKSYTDTNSPDYEHHKNITPDQWLNSLKAFATNAKWHDAHAAWVDHREVDPAFWGENHSPFNSIAGYTEQITIEEKTELLKKQLKSDISLYLNFQDWQHDRD